MTAKAHIQSRRDYIATILNTLEAVGGAVGVDRNGFLVLNNVSADMTTLIDQMHDEIAAYIVACADRSRPPSRNDPPKGREPP